MQQLHVPGVSIAVVHNGIIDWAAGIGSQDVNGKPVTPVTMFQAGSISKPIAVLAALHLVQQGKISLDSDVNTRLTSWKIPPNPAIPGATVTLRELLTHTASLTVHGFPGYAAGETVPSLVQVLNGEKPANTPPIRLESTPGEGWKYSGGGYSNATACARRSQAAFSQGASGYGVCSYRHDAQHRSPAALGRTTEHRRHAL
jgi:CubicO group peptidase (beta-lactamase class C family)